MTQAAALRNNRGTLMGDRVPALTKAIYSLGTALDMWGLWLYPGIASAVFIIYLGVDPWQVGLALTLIRIYDAITDPIAGWLSDNLRSKYGRRRPFILISGILCGLGLPALFLVAPGWAKINFLGLSAVFWYMIVSTMIYIPIFSTFTVPYNSLGNELSPDYEERTSIMTYRSAIQKIFEVGNFYAFKFTNLAWFVIPATGKKNTLLGIQVYTCILGVIMAIFAIIIFLRVKEPYYESVVTKIKERVSIKASLYETLKCKPFMIMMAVGVAFQLGTSMVGNLGYFATVYYVCGGDTRSGDAWNFWMGIGFMVGGLIGATLLNRVAYEIGKKSALIVAALIGIAGYGGSWYLYNPQHPWLQTIASGVMAMSAAGLWMLNGSIGADIIDYDELETGKRREGSFTGCSQYILKLGGSAGGFVSGLILTWSGYKASLAAQSPQTIFWIRAMLALIPIAGLTVAIFFTIFLPLNKRKCLEIRAQLEQRRGKV